MIDKNRKFRHELKYFIHQKDYLVLRGQLGSLLKLDPYADEHGEYFIRSLYFDDIYDSALFEKNFGINYRKKYRIRIYNYSDKTIKLERKQKVGQYVCKESDILEKVEYEEIMKGKYDSLRSSTNPVRKDFFFGIQNKILRPKVIVDYDREAYVSNISDIRITFDKQLRVAYNGCDIFDRKLSTQCLVQMPRLILEIKYNEFLPGHIQNLLTINSEFTAVSKYVYCRIQKNNI